MRFLTIDISFNRNSHNESDFSKDANGVFHGLYQRACCDFESEDKHDFPLRKVIAIIEWFQNM